MHIEKKSYILTDYYYDFDILDNIISIYLQASIVKIYRF